MAFYFSYTNIHMFFLRARMFKLKDRGFKLLNMNSDYLHGSSCKTDDSLSTHSTYNGRRFSFVYYNTNSVYRETVIILNGYRLVYLGLTRGIARASRYTQCSAQTPRPQPYSTCTSPCAENKTRINFTFYII